MIDFPTNPALNQTFAAPNGVTYRCTSIDPDVWTSISTGTAVPEAPADAKLYGRKNAAWSEITKAALGLGNVTDVAAVAKAGDTMTGPLLLPAGTVAAPALAWSAEPGLGWFRKGSSDVCFAAQGGIISGITGQDPANTFWTLFPRARGNTAMTLCSDPSGTVNTDNFSIIKGPSTVQMLCSGAGTGVPAGLLISSAGITVKNATSTGYTTLDLIKNASTVGALVQGKASNGLSRWSIYLADNVAETGANTGSGFSINRYTDNGDFVDSPLAINRATGLISLRDVSIFGSATVTASGGVLLKGSGSALTGQLTQYVPDNRLVIARDNSNWSNGSITIYQSSIELITANGSFFRYAPGGGGGVSIQGLATTAEAVSATLRWNGVDAHQLAVFTSARRFKKDFAPIPDGALDKVLLLKPLTYLSAIEGDTTDRIPGFVAEDFDEIGLTDFVVYQDSKVQSLRYDRVTVLLTKAMQELNQRINQLENA